MPGGAGGSKRMYCLLTSPEAAQLVLFSCCILSLETFPIPVSLSKTLPSFKDQLKCHHP